MRKFFVALLMLLSLGIGSLFADSDFSFVFGQFYPMYLRLGTEYKGLSFIDDNTTGLTAEAGFGYIVRNLWQDASDGSALPRQESLENEVLKTDGLFLLSQGFLQDDLTASVGFNTEFFDNLSGVQESYSEVYPDLNDQYVFVNLLLATLEYDKMVDTGFTQDGYSLETGLTVGLPFLNSGGDIAAFSSFHNEINLAKTIFYLPNARTGRDLYSITLVDRLMADYTIGDTVPVAFQKGISLGYNVRGFAYYSVSSDFSFVNNFDIRIASQPFDSDFFGRLNIYPRLIFFYDVGFTSGEALNSSVDSSQDILMSSGIQMVVTINDYLDIGYQMAYLLAGDNLSKDEDATLVGKLLIRLSF